MSITLNFRHGAYVALTVNLLTAEACTPAAPVIVEYNVPTYVEPGLPMGAQILVSELWEETYDGRRYLCMFRGTLAPISEFRTEVPGYQPNWMGAMHGFMNFVFDDELSDEGCEYNADNDGKVLLKVTFDGVTASWEADPETLANGALLRGRDGHQADTQVELSDGPNMGKTLCYSTTESFCKGLDKGKCTEDIDCKGGQVCNPNGMCVDPTPPTGCDDDNDCPEGQDCINRMCVPPNDGCNGNDANCPDGQICDTMTDMCVGGELFEPCFRPGGDTPDQNDNPNIPGTVLHVGTDFDTDYGPNGMNWNVYTGKVQGDLCVELPNFSLPVTINDTNAPVHPSTQKKLCVANPNDRSKLECDKTALGTLTDEQSGSVTGWFYMNSPSFTKPLAVESFAWNGPVD